ncbi:hypothetical protein PINS_up023617 [Pythium insidiosum]|nr:hypothetical protein PINS_up023617 [Pythium insidiosum]
MDDDWWWWCKGSLRFLVCIHSPIQPSRAALATDEWIARQRRHKRHDIDRRRVHEERDAEHHDKRARDLGEAAVHPQLLRVQLLARQEEQPDQCDEVDAIVEHEREQHVDAHRVRVALDGGDVVKVGATEKPLRVRVDKHADEPLQRKHEPDGRALGSLLDDLDQRHDRVETRDAVRDVGHGHQRAVNVAVALDVHGDEARDEQVGQRQKERRPAEEASPEAVHEEGPPREDRHDDDSVLDRAHELRVVGHRACPVADDVGGVHEPHAQKQREECDERDRAPHCFLLHDLPEDLRAHLERRRQVVVLFLPEPQDDRQRQYRDEREHEHRGRERDVRVHFGRAHRGVREERRAQRREPTEHEVLGDDGAPHAQWLALRQLDDARLHADVRRDAAKAGERDHDDRHHDERTAAFIGVERLEVHADAGERDDAQRVEQQPDDHVALPP